MNSKHTNPHLGPAVQVLAASTVIATLLTTATLSIAPAPEAGNAPFTLHPVAFSSQPDAESQTDEQPDDEPDDEPDDQPEEQEESPSPEDEPRPQADEGITECVITLVSGRTIKGELIRRTADTVVIGVDGIETTFRRRNIDGIEILPPVSERYTRMRTAIPEDDVDARLSLVEWLRARKAFRLALAELQGILETDPSNPRARLLHTWLSEHFKLQRAAREDATQPADDGEPENAEEREYEIRRNDLEPLTDAQLDLMRVYEIDLRDPPRLSVPDDVLTELIDRHPDAFSPDAERRQQVFELPEVEKLKLLFALKARDLYPRVELFEEPRSLDRFREDVHHGRGWIINACASTRCHGGVEAGSFRLLNTRPNSPETAYTNLYIIENATLADGTPLVDFASPERSPLLQMGMTRANAIIPHPEIPRGYPGTGYRPIFRTTRDRNYRQAVDWIRSMYQPRPDYGFEYPPEPTETTPESGAGEEAPPSSPPGEQTGP